MFAPARGRRPEWGTEASRYRGATGRHGGWWRFDCARSRRRQPHWRGTPGERTLMLNVLDRARIHRVTGPIGAALVRTGLSPDAVTLFGLLGVVLASIFLVVPGHVVAGG